MRRRAPSSAVLAVALSACGAFGSDDAAAPPTGPPDAATSDSAAPDAPIADAAVADGDAGCMSASEPLLLDHDASLNLEASHQDLSGEPICNLQVNTCLVAFRRVLSAGQRIVRVALSVPRATSKGCGGPCSDPSFHGAGTLFVRSVRTDWSSTATWFNRDAMGGAMTWMKPGALPPDSTPPLLSQSVAPSDNAVFVVDGAKLQSPGPANDAAVLAFYISGSQDGSSGFEYVLQRNYPVAKASPMSEPTLIVTYCLP